MTKAKKEEIAFTIRLQALYSRLNLLLFDLYKIECQLEAQGEVKIGWGDEPAALIEGSAKTIGEHIYLSILKTRLNREIENAKKEIDAL